MKSIKIVILIIAISSSSVAQVGFNPLDVSSSLQLWGIGGGVIAFDYEARTIRFGAGLDEAEAKEVVTAITQRYRIQESRKT